MSKLLKIDGTGATWYVVVDQILAWRVEHPAFDRPDRLKIYLSAGPELINVEATAELVDLLQRQFDPVINEAKRPKKVSA